jgi:hypothetical protein
MAQTVAECPPEKRQAWAGFIDQALPGDRAGTGVYGNAAPRRAVTARRPHFREPQFDHAMAVAHDEVGLQSIDGNADAMQAFKRAARHDLDADAGRLRPPVRVGTLEWWAR